MSICSGGLNNMENTTISMVKKTLPAVTQPAITYISKIVSALLYFMYL